MIKLYIFLVVVAYLVLAAPKFTVGDCISVPETPFAATRKICQIIARDSGYVYRCEGGVVLKDTKVAIEEDFIEVACP